MSVQRSFLVFASLFSFACANVAAAPARAADASVRATAVPVATPTPTPSPVAQARDAFDRIVAGSFDRSQLGSALSSELTAARLSGYARALGPLGIEQSFALADTRHIDGTTTYDFMVRYGEGAVSFTYGIDDATQKVIKLYVRTPRS